MEQVDTIPRVQILSDHVANQIAAGEVIDRPASVVKELFENSIDAGAGKIEVHIEQGGSGLILVKDDGHGIHPDDIGLAVCSHGTSKLINIEDLYHSTHLGFRGEALPSIASVSKFQLISSINQSGQGICVINSGDNQFDIHPAPHPGGTTVKVADLFYQTPARKKFLRSGKTEFLHILEMVKRISLSQYSVNISLFHNGKSVFKCSGCEGNEDLRIGQVFGRSFVEKSHFVDEYSSDMHLSGRIGLISESRSQSTRQFFYLNGRIIRDRHINHAVRMAYDDQIPQGRYPSYVLSLKMDLSKIDVNVHPSKYEVRFSNSRDVHDFIYARLRTILNKKTSIAPVVPETTPKYTPAAFRQGTAGRQIDMIRENVETELCDQVLGIFKKRFLIGINADDLIVCDLLALKKVLFQYQLNAATKDNPVKSRPLLVPVLIPVTEEAGTKIESAQELYTRFGLDLQLVSPTSILIRTIPLQLEGSDLHSFIAALTSRQKIKDVKDTNRVIDIFLEQVSSDAIKSQSHDELLAMVRNLTKYGIDFSSKSHAGLFCKMDIESLIS